MRKICILCEDSNVEQVRKNGKSLFGPDTMKIALSSNGSEPVTHWFCFLTSTDEGYDKIMAIKTDLSIIEESDEKDFLKKYNLKRIKK